MLGQLHLEQALLEKVLVPLAQMQRRRLLEGLFATLVRRVRKAKAWHTQGLRWRFRSCLFEMGGWEKRTRTRRMAGVMQRPKSMRMRQSVILSWPKMPATSQRRTLRATVGWT